MTRVKWGSSKQNTLAPNHPFVTLLTHAQRRKKQMGNVLSSIRNSENNKDLVGLLSSLDAECRNCAPTSPLECITRCQVYKLKNELRKLRETMDNPNYIK